MHAGESSAKKRVRWLMENQRDVHSAMLFATDRKFCKIKIN